MKRIIYILIIVVIFLSIGKVMANHNGFDDFNIKIVYDNTALKGFKSDWGFSCLISDTILFDVGEEYKIFNYNANKLHIDFSKIKIIILSHKHKDHIGSLKELLKHTNNVESIYCLSDTKSRIKTYVNKSKIKIISINNFEEITDNIFSTGKMNAKYKGYKLLEQSLIIQNGNKIGIVTGCAHPGILDIIKKVKQEMKTDSIEFVLGGFHLFRKTDKEIKEIAKEIKNLNVKKAAPCHCSGDKAKIIFKEIFKVNYIDTHAGTMFDEKQLFGK